MMTHGSHSGKNENMMCDCDFEKVHRKDEKIINFLSVNSDKVI